MSADRIDSYSGSLGNAATIRPIQSSTIDSARKIVPKTRFTASCWGRDSCRKLLASAERSML